MLRTYQPSRVENSVLEHVWQQRAAAKCLLVDAQKDAQNFPYQTKRNHIDFLGGNNLVERRAF